MDRNYLIKKWLDNGLSSKEQQAFDALEDSAFFKEIIEEGKRFKSQNLSKVVAIENFDFSNSKRQSPTINWSKVIVRIAAIFIVGFGLYYFLNRDDLSTFNTQLAQKQDIELPDGSMITLNELSQLSFDQKNWNKQRKIQLKGEAYFKVAKGKRFDVHTTLGTVSVLGTQFNVSTRDSIFNVICYEGLVEVAHNNQVKKLEAGQAYSVVKGKIKTYDVAVVQPDWLENMKVFEKAKIQDVFTAMEDHYKIKIITENIDGSILFTGAFELDNSKNALEAITKSLNLSYVMNTKSEVVIQNAKD